MALIKQLHRRTFMDGKRVEIHNVTVDAALGGTIDSQIRNIDYVAVKNNTTPNTGTALASGSTITLSDFADGDVGSILIVGV